MKNNIKHIVIAGSSGGHILPAIKYLNELSHYCNSEEIIFITNEIGQDYLHLIEYEKKNERYYRVITDNLWNIGRQLANQHLTNPQYYVDDEIQWAFDEDVLLFSTFYDVNENNENYSTFGQNIREELGLDINDPLYIDQYDPSVFSLDMFAADEIFQGDDRNLFYYGYDHTGGEINERVSFEDFLNEKDDNGYKRPILMLEKE